MAADTLIRRLIYQVSATTDGLRAEMAKAEASVDSFGKSMDDVSGKTTAGMGKLAGVLATVAGSIAGFAVGTLLVGGAKAAAAMGDLADQIGVTTDTLQTLHYAFSQTGIKAGEGERAIAALTDKIGDAADGNMAAIGAFRRLGVAFQDANGVARATDDVLLDVADALARIPSAAERASAAKDLFGRAGQKLLPLLQQGSLGLKGFGEEAERLGLKFDPEVIEKANQAMNELSQSTLRLQVSFANAGVNGIATFFDWLAKVNDELEEFNKNSQLSPHRLGQLLGDWTRRFFGGDDDRSTGGAGGSGGGGGGWGSELGEFIDPNSRGQFTVVPDLSRVAPGRREQDLEHFLKSRYERGQQAAESIRRLQQSLLKTTDPITAINMELEEQKRHYSELAEQGIISQQKLQEAHQALSDQAERQIQDLRDRATANLRQTEIAFWRLVDPITALEMETQDAIRALDDLLAKGIIDPGQYARMRAAQIALMAAEAGEGLQQAADPLQESIDEISDRMSRMWTDMALQGELTFKSLGKIMQRELLAALVDETFTKPFRAILGSLLENILPRSGGGLFAPLFSMFGVPARAAGGPVEAGRVYQVNEYGREFFIPSVSGRVEPAFRQTTAGGNIMISVDARQATDPAAVRLQVMEGILMAMPEITKASTARTMKHLTRPRIS